MLNIIYEFSKYNSSFTLGEQHKKH